MREGVLREVEWLWKVKNRGSHSDTRNRRLDGTAPSNVYIYILIVFIGLCVLFLFVNYLGRWIDIRIGDLGSCAIERWWCEREIALHVRRVRGAQ